MNKGFALCALMAVAACSEATEAVNSDATSANVKLETARYFSTSTGNVRVGNFKQTLLGTEYQARVGGKLYDCHFVRGSVTCQGA